MNIINTLNAKIDSLQSSLLFVSDEKKRTELQSEIRRLQFRIIELEKQGY